MGLMRRQREGEMASGEPAVLRSHRKMPEQVVDRIFLLLKLVSFLETLMR